METPNSHNYLFCNDAKTWSEARDFCRSLGGDLVAIDEEAENTFLKDQFSSYSWSLAWIGFNDLDNEYTYRWSSGSMNDYTNWNSYSPSYTYLERDCVYLESDGTWGDYLCSYNDYPFICEDGFGLDPFNPDTDGDGLTDKFEIDNNNNNPPDYDYPLNPTYKRFK